MITHVKRAATMLLSITFVLAISIRPVLALGPVVVTETRATAAPTVTYSFSIFALPVFPNIDGDRVVYKDDRNGHEDIYLYEISTDTETRITTDAGDQRWPDISGDIIVWQDDRNGHWDIYMYDIGTTTETRVTTDAGDQEQPSVSGDYIAWMDNRNVGGGDGNDVYTYRISTTTETRITTDNNDQESPSIGGDYIAWEDNRSGDVEIWMYQISTTTESAVTSDGSSHYWPDTDGTHIVWMDNRNGHYDIYHYNIGTSAETRLTSSPGTEAFPAVDGDFTVWTDDRNGTWDAYMWDFNPSRTIESQLTTLSAAQGVTRVSGNYATWGDARAGVASQADIYVGLLAYDDTEPTFNDLPGLSDPTNIDGGVIDVSPFDITVYPTDVLSGVDRVEYRVDGALVCTETVANGDGTYTCSWTPTECTDGSTLTVSAVDNRDNIATLEESFTLGSAVCLALTGVETVLPTLTGLGIIVTAVLTTKTSIIRKAQKSHS